MIIFNYICCDVTAFEGPRVGTVPFAASADTCADTAECRLQCRCRGVRTANLHAVRSAITATAELLVLYCFLNNQPTLVCNNVLQDFVYWAHATHPVGMLYRMRKFRNVSAENNAIKPVAGQLAQLTDVFVYHELRQPPGLLFTAEFSRLFSWL